MKKGLIITVLIVALLGLCAMTAGVVFFSVRVLSLNGTHIEMFQNNGISAESDEEKSFTVKEPATLKVESDGGDIQVTAGSGNEIVIQAHKTAWGSSEQNAQERLEKLEVSMTQSGNTVSIRFKQPVIVQMGYTGGSDQVAFTIQVPTQTLVTLSTAFGDVSLEGTHGDADLRSDYGDIDVAKVNGGLKVWTNSGRVEAKDITSGEENIDLHSDYGDILLQRATARDVKASSSSGEVKYLQVQASGDVEAESSYGKIHYETGNAASLNVYTSSGDVTLKDLAVEGTLTAHSDYGNLSLTGVAAASYSLETSSGAVSAEGVSGQVKIRSGYGNIEVTSGERASLDLSTSSGSVKYTGSLGSGPHTVHSDYGAITLSLPQDTALTFDLETDYGKIKSAFPISLEGDLEEDHWTGTINGGGATFTATTSSGDIRLEILK